MTEQSVYEQTIRDPRLMIRWRGCWYSRAELEKRLAFARREVESIQAALDEGTERWRPIMCPKSTRTGKPCVGAKGHGGPCLSSPEVLARSYMTHHQLEADDAALAGWGGEHS